ncbi:hypothetical protein P775_18525 [Puniceibacterium antarcticum]|uniref:TauD/TfdA-like domain-containing protein n=1 Tax=Puniceibacterium antarcticum TaxID=1206336 RepID=A0A2G8RAJ0_9RHOB|nr:hypothetical protein [Puniceibacterium antarcticum]PIL18570.1 hypothetical protein P775_18525 [Puniceibacterium antarcticum]
MTDRAGKGWSHFAAHPDMLRWAERAHRIGCAVAQDPAMQAQLQCEGTWFVGVDALPSDMDGSLDGVPLAGPVIDALGPLPPLHPAQLSITYPGYPRPRATESDAAFRYRRNRDAAHVDGITAEGADKRRRITEPHAFILGLPLTRCDRDASPLVAWEGSHEVMRRALRAALAGHDPQEWSQLDVTEAYQAARREVFDTCARVPLYAEPGEALLLHRLILHGVAPWAEGACAPPEGRMIAYFRPVMAQGVAAWLMAD